MGQIPKDELSFLKAHSPGTGNQIPISHISRVKTLSFSDTSTGTVVPGLYLRAGTERGNTKPSFSSAGVDCNSVS